MGTVLSSKMKSEGKVIFEVMMDYDEAIQLQGHMDNVHLFSENVTELKTTISTRGSNATTKYFLIPRDLRKNIKFNKEINCQKLHLKNKVIFIYTVEKY